MFKRMLGDTIYRLRKTKGLSQAELGELVGVSNKAVSKWETYEANPDITLLPLLALSLGVTTDVLLSDIKAGKDDLKPTENGSSEEITITLYKTLSDNVIQTLNKWLDEMEGLTAKEKIIGLLEKNLKAEDMHSLDSLVLKNMNPHIIVAKKIDDINKIAPIFVKLVKKGIKDGSIKTEYPDECAEVFLFLFNVWCDPFIFECDLNTLKRRLSFVVQMMRNMGVDILPDEYLNDSIKYMEKLYLDKK